MKRWLLLIVFVLVGLAVFTFIWFNSSDNNTLKVKSVPSLVIENEPLIVQKEFQGKVRSFAQKDIRFSISGLLLKGEKVLQEGSFFSKDQILYRIDNRALFFELKKLKEEFKNLLTEVLNNLPNSLKSERNKWAQFANEVSSVKILPAFPSFNSIEEKVFFEEISLSYQNIQKEESKMEDYFCFAPFSGKVESVNSKVNSSVKRNQLIAQIVSTSKYWLDLVIENDESNRFEIGESYIFSRDDFSVEGIYQKETSHRSLDSMVLVFEIVPSEDFVLESEMMLVSSFLDTLNSQCAQVPKSALKQNYVLVFSTEGITQKKVVVQREEEDSVWVSGLLSGDVVSSGYFVKDSSVIYNPIK